MTLRASGFPARVPVLVAVLLATALGCTAAPRPSLQNPFGAFNFTLESRPPAEQVQFLAGQGYVGMTLFWPGTEAFESFVAAPEVREGHFRVFAVLYELPFEQPWSREDADALLTSLAPHGTDVWLLLRGTAGLSDAMVQAVREFVDRATARGVRVVVYPHDGYAIVSAEESVALLNAVGRPELKTSLHLGHEIKAGNRDRLAEVIATAAPYLALASIHGAAREDSPSWSRTIQPLDRGDLDVRNDYLLPLIRAGYTGPVLLHTYGIQDPPEDHFRRSFEAWRKMSSEVATAVSGG